MPRQVLDTVCALAWIAILTATAGAVSKVSNEPTQENPPTTQTTLPPPRPGCEGTVELLVVIEPDGRVRDPRVVRTSGCAELAEKALEEAKLMTVAPVKAGGNRVMAKAMMELNFRPDPTFKEALPTFRPNPPYTDRARKDRREGTLVLAVAVDEMGSVTQLTEISKKLGKGLDKSALETVKAWKFQPAMSEGHAVPCVVTLSFSFHLSLNSSMGNEVQFTQE